MSIQDPNAELLVVSRESSHTVTISTETGIVIEGPRDTVNTTQVQHVITSVDDSKTVVSSGGQGPAGPAGDSFTYINILAGVTLSGHRAIATNNSGQAIYADKDIFSTADKVIGITTGSASIGTIAEIQITGILEEPSWNWDLDDPIYVGNNGVLTQTPPSTGYFCHIAFPVSSTKIFVNKQPTIYLG